MEGAKQRKTVVNPLYVLEHFKHDFSIFSFKAILAYKHIKHSTETKNSINQCFFNVTKVLNLYDDIAGLPDKEIMSASFARGQEVTRQKTFIPRGLERRAHIISSQTPCWQARDFQDNRRADRTFWWSGREISLVFAFVSTREPRVTGSRPGKYLTACYSSRLALRRSGERRDEPVCLNEKTHTSCTACRCLCRCHRLFTATRHPEDSYRKCKGA